MPEKTCGACGNALNAGDAFCGSCGAATSAAPESLSAASATTSAVPLSPSTPMAAVPAQPAAEPTIGAPLTPSTTPHVSRWPASFWNRLVAWLIDIAILWIIGGLVALTFASDPLWAGFIIAASIGSIVYRPLMWRYRNGQTIGQQAMKIRVRNDDGSSLTIGRGIWRVLAMWIITQAPIAAYINPFSMLWNGQRRCWFERWSNTRVDSVDDPRLLGFFTRS